MTDKPNALSSLAERLRRGETLFTGWSGLADPAIAGILARQDYDAVTLDMQHSAVSLHEAMRAVPLIAAAGKPAVVRIPVNEFQSASRLFDAGASAIIAPMINTIDDARRLTAHAKFPPLGERSWGAYGAQSSSGLGASDYLTQANGFSLTFAMIETREALAIIDDLLALDGIDAPFVGPADLSIALSGGQSVNPDASEVRSAVQHIVARANAANKPVGYYARSAEMAQAAARLGCRFIAPGSAEALLASAAAATLAAARGR